jgi:hypothetical protein
MVASWLLLPTWLTDWLNRVAQYSQYTVGQSPIWLLTHQAFPALGTPVESLIVAALLASMLWAWWRTIRTRNDGEFYWALSWTLLVSNLIVPRSATTNYVMLLILTIWIFAALDRQATWGKPVILASMLASCIGLWWLHAATVVGNQEQPIMFIPMLVVLGLILVLGRSWLLRDAALARIIP